MLRCERSPRVWLLACVAMLSAVACAAPAAPRPAAPSAAEAGAPASGSAGPAASSDGRDAVPAGEPALVRVQVTGQGNESAFYVALERGYFRDERIALDLIPFDSGAKAIPSLGTGELDAGIGSIGPALYNAVERGINIRIVAPVTRLAPENTGLAFMVRKALLDSGEVRTPADLKDRRIAVAALASGNEYIVERLLEQNGLQAGDVTWAELAFPDMGPAFANGSIDAALVADPSGMLMAERGLATKWLTAATIVPGIQLTFFLFSDRFATERSDVAIRWLAAYLRGARDWQAMLDTGEGRDEMLGYLIQHTALKDRALLDRLALNTPALDGKIDVPGLRQQAAWARERGYIAQDPPLERMIDTRLFAAARQRVGLAPDQ